MNKRLLITVTSTMLSMSAVTGGMPVLAKDRYYADPIIRNDVVQITTADQFIDLYCSVQIPQVDPATLQPIMDPATQKQKTIPQLITGIDRTNYMIVLEGAAVFAALPAELQIQIREQYAKKIQDQKNANALDPARPAILITTYDDLLAKADEEKILADAEEAKRLEEEAKKQQEAAVSPEQPAAPAPTPSQPVVPETGTGAEDAADTLTGNQNGNAAGSTVSGENTETVPAETEKAEETAPAPIKPAEVMMTNTIVPEKKVEPLQSAAPKLETLVQETAEEQKPAEPAAPSLLETLVKEEPEQAKTEVAVAAPAKEPTDEPAAQAVSPAVQETTASALSTAADSFVKSFASDNGMIYKSATANNYSKIISGLSAWNRLSKTDKDAVNAMLTQQGGKTYPKLLQEAQSIQFASPLVTPRVRTAGATHAGLYATLCAAALSVSAFLLSKRKEF